MLAMEILELLDHIHGTVSVVGSMNADYTVTTNRLPKPGETVPGGPLRILPGGKSGNQAAAAALIGADVAMFGAVGDDINADFLIESLSKAGVDTRHILHASGASGTTVITVDEMGENTIVYSEGANARITTEYIASMHRDITAADVLGLCLESPLEVVTAAARICHESGKMVLLNNSPSMPVLPKELVENADILLINAHELSHLLAIPEPPEDDWINLDWSDIAIRLQEIGFNQSIVTLGGRGSMVLDTICTDSSIARIDPVPVTATDTTGCGDAFMGTVLAGLASGYDLKQSAQIASYVSAYAATGSGAQSSYGNARQIKNFYR